MVEKSSESIKKWEMMRTLQEVSLYCTLRPLFNQGTVANFVTWQSYLLVKILHFKNPVHQTHFADGIAEVKRLSLTFTPGFNPFYRGISGLHRFKSQRGADYPFQFVMIAFDNVISLLNLPVLNVRRTLTFTFKLSERTSICRRFVRIDNRWDLPLFYVV